MKWIMLFEEFTLETGKTFIEKLRIYALASEVAKNVSEILMKGNKLSFEIETSIPGDYNGHTKNFKVFVPTDKSIPYVETFEGGKLVLSATIESRGTLNPKVSVMNYLEATQLYDDPLVQEVVDLYDSLKNPEQVKKRIQKY